MIMGLFNKKKTVQPNNSGAIQEAENAIRILQESSEILQSTTNPDVFFSRLKVFHKVINTLDVLSDQVPLTVNPEEMQAAFEKDKQEMIYSFIVRAYNKVWDEANQLKTEAGKKRKFQKFFDDIEPYRPYMNERNNQYLIYKWKQSV